MTAQPERIAMAVLARRGRVLLVHRHPDRRFYPDCWDLPGGHIEPEESPEEAVRRECLEEIGVTLRHVVRVPMTSSDPSLEVHAFKAVSWEGEPTNVAPDEHDDLRWFRPHELSHLTLADPASRQDIVRAAEGEGTVADQDTEGRRSAASDDEPARDAGTRWDRA